MQFMPNELSWFFVFFIHASIFSFVRNTIERYILIKYELRKSKHSTEKQISAILFNPSHCDVCHKKIKPVFLVPVLGYFIAKGKCSSCGSHISFTYPLLEFLVGFSLTIVFFNADHLDYFFFVIQLPILAFIFLIDSRYKLIPTFCIFLLYLIIGLETYYRFDGNFEFTSRIIRNLTWSILWTLLLLGIRFFFHNGLGIGDIYLAFILNLSIEFPFSVALITLASFLGIIVFFIGNIQFPSKNLKYQKLPFAPMLVISFWVLIHIKIFFNSF